VFRLGDFFAIVSGRGDRGGRHQVQIGIGRTVFRGVKPDVEFFRPGVEKESVPRAGASLQQREIAEPLERRIRHEIATGIEYPDRIVVEWNGIEPEGFVFAAPLHPVLPELPVGAGQHHPAAGGPVGADGDRHLLRPELVEDEGAVIDAGRKHDIVAGGCLIQNRLQGIRLRVALCRT